MVIDKVSYKTVKETKQPLVKKYSCSMEWVLSVLNKLKARAQYSNKCLFSGWKEACLTFSPIPVLFIFFSSCYEC